MGEESCGFELNIWEIHCELHLFWGSTWLNYLLSGGSEWVPSLLLGAISQLHCSVDGPGCYIVTYVLFIFRSVLICLNRENWNNCGTNTLGLFKLIIFHKDLHKGENGTIWSEWHFPFCGLERGKTSIGAIVSGSPYLMYTRRGLSCKSSWLRDWDVGSSFGFGKTRSFYLTSCDVRHVTVHQLDACHK